ncbi:MAG: hypothetical protein ACLQOO_26075 [Terriglobia bacterium]
MGFKLALKIHIGKPAYITEEVPDASTVFDAGVVYVALLGDNSRLLKKGDALNIGQTGESLKSRWRRTVGIFNRDGLRNYEKNDRKKWLVACGLLLPAEVANGKEVSVWMRVAGIPYGNGLTQGPFSSRKAERRFLEQYYEPQVRPTQATKEERLSSSDPN